MERKYSVAEIDALRRAVDNQYLWGRYSGPRGDGCSGSFKETDKAKVVEERVRTYMLAGITAEDLLAEEKERDRAHDEMMAKYRDAQGTSPGTAETGTGSGA